ncbi:MAG: hypothetical protein LBQ71_14840 [Hungatella sp.]|jgi:hypothetical protein|nr:hypothetical protein [Hungatella sp.]
MNHLSIDIETRSSVDIKKAGLYKYAQSPDFEILLFAYQWNDTEVQIVDLTCNERIPDRVIKALADPKVIKHAYNAAFEWYCLNRAGYVTPVDQWRCTQAHGLYCGYTAGLDATGKAIGLPQDKQKLTVGKALIRYFCVPCKPTRTNGGRTWNQPWHDQEKWNLFKDYCKQDVVTEREILKRLNLFPMPQGEQHLWQLDVLMNAFGVKVDREMIEGALYIDTISSQKLTDEAIALTGLFNPNSGAQLIPWLNHHSKEHPDEPDLLSDIQKTTVEELLKNRDNLPGDVRRMLEIRQQLGKTSIKKYVAMDIACGEGDRVRGLTQYYGANRTGRWCLTGDHEVLTPNGWTQLDAWEGGTIACWSPAGETVSFQKAEAVSFDYDGPVYHYSDKRINQISTPDHKMYVKQRYGGEWQADTVENTASYRPSIPFTGYRKTVAGMEHDHLRILVMTQADGHFTEDGTIRYHFKKQRKVERCKHLLRKADIPFIIREYQNRGTFVITVCSRDVPLWLRIFKDKTFGSWLFDESPAIFFEELEYWDGYRSAKNSIQYCTSNKQNADIVQAFAHISGRCALVKERSRKENWEASYVVDIWLTPGNCHEVRNKPKITEYLGKVYCAVTKTGYFLVRRDGRVWVTGNSGRMVQMQNLPRNYIKTLDYARKLVKAKNYEGLKLLYGNVPDTLSQLIRTTFIPSGGNKFVVADFSAIETRVIAWLAGEQWVNEVFATHGKIYEATASQMFHVPIEKISKGNPEYDLRQKGKVATLALGYQGGSNALIAMGALDMGLSEEELPDIVQRWRQANPRIKDLWYAAEQAALTTMQTAQPQGIYGLIFALEGDLVYGESFLTVQLPSGRKLYYPKPFLKENQFGKLAVHYYTVGQKTKKWEVTSTYGGKMTENIVQAIARDCLAVTLNRIAARGLQTVFHVHDEVIIDAPMETTVESVCDLMAEPIPWAPGLILKGAGFESSYYMKD